MRIGDWSSDVCSSGLLAVLRAILRHLKASQTGQALDRFREAEALRVHHEVDGAAVRAAAEAVVEALVVADRAGGRLLVVEGAEPGMLAPALHQLHPPADHRRQRQAVAQLVEKFRLERHGAVRPGACGCGGGWEGWSVGTTVTTGA